MKRMANHLFSAALRTLSNSWKVPGRFALLLLLVGGILATGSRPTNASSFFEQTNLVSDGAVPAAHTDSNLKNPWGIASSPSTASSPGSPFWISDNATGKSTLYNGDGVPQPQPTPLVVTIPPPGGSPAGTTAAPTGIVFNGGSGFVVSKGTKSGPSRFIFATEDGTISGWNFGVDPNNAILKVDKSATGAVYKGLALASNETGTFLYAANFHAGTVDIFDSKFAPATLKGHFADKTIPSGYAPFNITSIGGRLYVSYAKQKLPDKHDDEAGPGHGFIRVFDTQGRLERRLVSGGVLNSPWGMEIAPDSFGSFSDQLLVGNFGDGRINAYGPNNGAFRGTLLGTDGKPITIEGLWGLKVGNDGAGGDSDTLYFTAGINDEKDGLFGALER